MAYPILPRSYSFSPNGVAVQGWAPLTRPWGAGPIGPATAFSPPGAAPVYGPLGPGLTAGALAPRMLQPHAPRPVEPGAAAGVLIGPLGPGGALHLLQSLPVNPEDLSISIPDTSAISHLALAPQRQQELLVFQERARRSASCQIAGALWANDSALQAQETYRSARAWREDQAAAVRQGARP